jgi:hypothetical protein
MENISCTKCGSKDVTVCRVYDEDYIDDGYPAEECVVDDLRDCHCNTCGWDFLTVDIDDV